MANEAWPSAWVEVLPDFSNFSKNAKSRMTGILGPAGAAGGIAAGNLAGNLFKGTFLQILGGVIGANIVTGIGYSIGRTIGNAIGAGIAYTLQSVSLASDLEQSMGAVEAVFKDQAKFIDDLSRTSAKDLGLARQDYQAFATLVGAQLKNLGIPFERVSGQAADLLKLGADLAAQFGGPTSDAVLAISSVLRGERDPIERYGVSIKQADINARLAAAGLKGLTGEAKKQAEIQATLAILYSQTADAQGTFASEGDTLAGQQQRLQAMLRDTQTRLGEHLLPAFTELTQYANDHLVPKLGEVVDKIGPEMRGALEKITPKLEGLLDKVAPLVEDFVLWAGEDGIPGVISGLSDIADAAPGWIDAFHKIDEAMSGIFDTIAPTQENVQAVNNALGMPEGLAAKFGEEWNRYFSVLTAAHDGFNAWVQSFVDGWVGMFSDIGYNLNNFNLTVDQTVRDVIATFVALPTNAAKALVDTGSSLFTAGQNLVDGMVKGVTSRATAIANAALKAVTDAVDAVKKFLGIASPSKLFAEIGGYMSEGMAVGVAGKSGLVAQAIGSLVSIPDTTRGMSMAVAGAPGVALRQSPNLQVNVHYPVAVDPVRAIREAADMYLVDERV